MYRFVSIFLALSFLLVPFSAFAEETPPEAPLEVPVYLFANQNKGILGFVPISENSFVFAYATSSEFPEIGLINAEGLVSESEASEEDGNPAFIPLGVLLVPLDFNYESLTQNPELGAGVGQRIFTSHEFDSATNYTYAKARYLETNSGRFLSQDRAFVYAGDSGDFESMAGISFKTYLADPQLQNSYSYARNNPVKFVDPTGEIAMIFSRPIGGRAGAIGGHAFIGILPEQSNGHYASPITLGGYTNGGDLFKAVNAQSDYEAAFGENREGVAQLVINPPEGVSVAEFDQQLLQSYGALPDVITGDSYGFTGQIRLTGDPNSNNIATDILLGAGLSKGQINSYQTQLYLNNLKLTPGLGQSAFSPTYGQVANQKLQALLQSLQSILTNLQGQIGNL